VLSVPLLGMGGGHGWLDWYPVLQTDDATKAFSKFEQELKDYVGVDENLGQVKFTSRTELQLLRESAKTLLDQLSDDNPDRDGALGDDLVHWLNGGLSAARKLQALP